MPDWIRALVLIAAIVATQQSDSATNTDSWESSRGLYRVSFTSSLDPVEINRIHEWVLHIETAAGEAVGNATLSISGGMPEHDHGLPTAPRVTQNLGDGDYRVQGLRFHMPGAWLLEITIDDGVQTDTVAIDFVIR